MFNRKLKKEVAKLKQDIKEIKEELVGVNVNGNSFETPAAYSALYAIKGKKSIENRNSELLRMLLNHLNLSIVKNSERLVKTKPKKR